MVSEFTLAFNSLKSASDIIKGFNTLKTETAINTAKIDLQDIILTLQSQLSLLHSNYDEIISAKNELEKRLKNIRNFTKEKEKYLLKEVATDIFAYVCKNPEDRISEKHWLCQHCLDNEQKFSVYQVKERLAVHIVYYCFNCKNELKVKNQDFFSSKKKNKSGGRSRNWVTDY